MFINLLGFNTDFAVMECLQMMASEEYIEK